MVLQKRYHLPNKLILIIRVQHHGIPKRAVWAYCRVSGELDIITDVGQKNVLAPDLLTLFFDAIIATALTQHPLFSVKALYNLGGELVASMKKMRRN